MDNIKISLLQIKIQESSKFKYHYLCKILIKKKKKFFFPLFVYLQDISVIFRTNLHFKDCLRTKLNLFAR